MKVKDCKAIRREIEETDKGQEPNAPVLSHLRQCNSCLEFFESEKKLRLVMASLGPVEAPADFDFRLRARIANERTQSRRGFAIGSFSLAIPTLTFAALVLLTGGVLLLPRLNSLDDSSQGIAAQSADVPKPVATIAPSDPGIIITSEKGTPVKEVKLGPTSRRPRAIARKDTVASQRGGRLIARDSGVVGASVLRQQEPAADSRIPLIFPLQTMKVSVDDGSGVSRTISFPTVSFGSQRVLTSAGSSFNPSAKGVW